MNNNTINLNSINSLSSAETDKICNLFGLNIFNVKILLESGFRFDYETRHFESTIIINNLSYEIIIDEDEEPELNYRCFFIYLKTTNELVGNNPLYLYANLDEDIANIHVESFLYWIKNLYELNNKEKESFKQFVVTENNK